MIIDVVVTAKVTTLARDDVHMDVLCKLEHWHVYHDRLACFFAVLHDYCQCLCIECPLDDSPDSLHCGKDIAHLVLGQFCESGDYPFGTDKDMSGEDRLEIDEGV